MKCLEWQPAYPQHVSLCTGMSDTYPDGFGMAVAQTLFCADNENSAQI